MKKSALLSAVALGGAAAVLLAGCSSSGSDTSGGEDAGGTDAAGTRACVILPDAASSPRWENFDRTYLQEGLTAAGFDVDIQNAQGDTAKYATIADQQLTQGCGVMLLVDYNGAGAAVTAQAQAEGIPVIAYDRPIEGADYYVSFDNVEVGRLEGQAVLDGLEAAAAEPPGVWDGEKSATNFEQALTSLGGEVDGVWAANDTNAAGVITILQKNNLEGVAVSGQDANVAGLQNILLGWQTATVYKPVKIEADAAVEVAVALLNGEAPEADQQLDDGTPYIAVTPQLVGPEQVKDVVAAGDASAEEICTGDVAEKCEEYGVE